jgi:hypothetical protein
MLSTSHRTYRPTTEKVSGMNSTELEGAGTKKLLVPSCSLQISAAARKKKKSARKTTTRPDPKRAVLRLVPRALFRRGRRSTGPFRFASELRAQSSRNEKHSQKAQCAWNVMERQHCPPLVITWLSKRSCVLRSMCL